MEALEGERGRAGPGADPLVAGKALLRVLNGTERLGVGGSVPRGL